MPKLVASDCESRDVVHRQWSLEEGVALPLGSRVNKDHLLIDWDASIAPRHAVATFKGGRLFIDRASDVPAQQPIFYAGSEAESFHIIPGEGFVIGHTMFRLDPGASASATTTGESPQVLTRFYPAEQLQTMTFHPTEEQLEALRELLLARETDQVDLDAFGKLVSSIIRRVIRSARYVAVLLVQGKDKQVTVRTESDNSPGICDDLVREACRRQEIAEFCWDARQPSPAYRPIPGIAWACCAPVIARKVDQGDMAIYICGPQAPRSVAKRPALTDDQRAFVGIVAWILRGVRTVHELEQYQAWMQPFFPKPIRNLIQQRGPEDVFRTDRAQAAVLFCDLRGSCKMAEGGGDQLMQSWERLQASLSVMTEAITNQYGTIGDFVGDAAMGFWGWPAIGKASRDLTEAVKSACKAADILRERFSQKARGSGLLSGFACGMGIAAGDVVAGMLGTEDQRKIGVFGPVVNLAARLESMTKQFGASILIDQTAAKLLTHSETGLIQQIRYLATVRPAGMDQPIKVYELMPPEADPGRLSRARLQLFEQGQQAFEQGNWPEAKNFLQRVHESNDGPSKFLLDFIDSCGTPPADWNGTVVLTKK